MNSHRPSFQRSRSARLPQLAVMLVLALTLTSCAAIGTKENFALCKALDVASTVAAIEVAGATEANPLMAAVMSKAGYLGLLGIGALAVWIVYELVDGHEQDEATQGLLTAGNVATCGVAVHNLLLL